MSIRIKLLCVLLTVGVSAVVGTGILAYKAGEKALTQTAMNQLTGIRRGKAFQIESYFRTIRSQLRILSQDPGTIEALQRLSAEFQKLDAPAPSNEHQEAVLQYYRTDHLPQLQRLVPPRASFDDYLPAGRAAYALQDAYIVKNPMIAGKRNAYDQAPGTPAYSAAHVRYHPSFRKIVEEFGFYDLFLVDTRTGQIVYTVQKEVDFATSLYSGPYRGTALAKAVKQARDAAGGNEVIVADFEMYEPSLGAPAAFLATVVRDATGPLGVLAVQLSPDDIDRVVTSERGWERDGLGKSGGSGVVGPDYLLRSNARSFLERPNQALDQMRARKVPEDVIRRIRAYNSTVLQQEVRLPSVVAALRGEEGTGIQTASSGRASLVSYMPLSIPGLKWTIASRIDLDEALEPVERLRRILVWWGLLSVAATAVIALILTRVICRPVARLVTAAQQVAANDFRVHVPVENRDELGVLSQTFNDTVDSIREKTETIQRQTRENERLLLNILPEVIADRLRDGETTIADSFSEATVLFADLVGFTELSGTRGPQELVAMLNNLFTRFDESAQRIGVEKIKTIGDAYMAVAGLPKPCPDHARRIVLLALEMLQNLEDFREQTGARLSLRIGINSGPVVAGVIGSTKFIYDLWGDTVNVASRMESHGVADRVQVTRAVYEQIKNEFPFEHRGEIEVKGKGAIETWLLSAPAAAETFSTR